MSTGTVPITPAGVQMPAVVSHFRGTVTDTAGSLESFISGAIVPVANGRAPNAVYIGVEPGAGDVYMTWDGLTTPAAALGFKVGSNAAPTYVPIAPHIQAGQIKVIATVNPTRVQIKFEWGA